MGINFTIDEEQLYFKMHWLLNNTMIIGILTKIFYCNENLMNSNDGCIINNSFNF